MAVVVELLEQFEPAHSRQIGVDQQARGFVGMKGLEKRLAARIGFDDAAIVFQHGAYRLTNQVVIVDDDDPGSARSAQGFSSVARRYDVRVGRFGQEFLDRARQLAQLDGLVEMNAVVKGDIAQGLGRNIAGENDEWNLPIELLPQFLRDLNAVHAVRQIVVGKDEIRSHRPARHHFQSGGTVDGGRDGISLFVQEQFEVLAHFRVVLDDQDRSSARRRLRRCVVERARRWSGAEGSAARRQRDLDREHRALSLQRAHAESDGRAVRPGS